MEQISFIDKILLPAFGFQGVTDFHTEISKETIDVNKINQIIPQFRKLFKEHDYNLRKYQYNITTSKKAFAFLKRVLTNNNLLFQINQGVNLRKIPKNFLLDKYITIMDGNIPREMLLFPETNEQQPRFLDHGINETYKNCKPPQMKQLDFIY